MYQLALPPQEPAAPQDEPHAPGHLQPQVPLIHPPQQPSAMDTILHMQQQ